MSLDAFVKAIEAAGVTPCKKFDCGQISRCAEELLSCSAFAHYVETGTAIHPNIAVPQRTSSSAKNAFGDRPMPSREIFLMVENDTWGGDYDDAIQLKKDKKAEEAVEGAMEIAGGRGLDAWLFTSVERAQMTLDRFGGADGE